MPSQKDLDRFRGEMGETIVAYELLKRRWNVFRNVGGHGYDLLIESEDKSVTRCIEVKTTDPGLKTGAAKNQLTVILSPAELAAAHFCIFYIHGHNAFFIVPKTAFPQGGSITVNVSKKDGVLTKGSKYECFKNNWDQLR